MKTKINRQLLMVVFAFLPTLMFAQGIAINEDDSQADPSAMMDIKSTDKGFLMPRMTATEIASIVDPANGLIVYNTTDEKFYAYISSENHWKEIAFAAPPWACGDPFTDDRDGQAYNTVQIGTQCWMAENLNVGIMINGSNNQSDNGTIEKYCYGNNATNCDVYGGLYQWDEMMDYLTTEGVQGICLEGWHVPTDGEYTALTTHLGGESVAGGTMKETGTAHWASPNTGATNSSGFTALGSGWSSIGSFSSLTTDVNFWTSSLSGMPYRLSLDYTSATTFRSTIPGSYGFSVRCLKD